MKNNEETKFAEGLKEIISIAKGQGNFISQEQIQGCFKSFSLTNEQFSLIEDYLKQHHIGIGEPIAPEEYMSTEERIYLEDYLKELEQLPSVSEGVKEAVTLSAMAGDKDAQAKLIEIYLPHVVDIAKLYAGFEVPVEDLVGEGNVALTIGVTMAGCLEHAGEAEGMLGKIIMDAMEELIEQMRLLKQKDNDMLKKINLISIHAKELAEEYARKVTIQEMTQESDWSEQELMEAIFISGNNIEYIEISE